MVLGDKIPMSALAQSTVKDAMMACSLKDGHDQLTVRPHGGAWKLTITHA